MFDAVKDHPDVIDKSLKRFELRGFDRDTAKVSPRRYIALFEWLAVKLEQPYLGLKLSQLGGPEMLGVISYMFFASQTLEAAIRYPGHYLQALQEHSQLSIEFDEEYAHVDYGVLDDRILNRRQDSEYSIGATWNLIKQFTGGVCQLTIVEFEHEKQAQAKVPFRHVFGAPVLFRRRANRLHFRSNLLSTQSRSSDPFLFPILESYIQSSIAEIDSADSFTDIIRKQLSHEALGAGLRARDIAARMGISESTLHRRLGKERSSYKKIYDEAAQSFASLLIRQKSLPVATIASRLGYSETAALTRAFRRWFGMSPRQYRKTLD